MTFTQVVTPECLNRGSSPKFAWIPAFAGMTEGELDSRFHGNDGGNLDSRFRGNDGLRKGNKFYPSINSGW